MVLRQILIGLMQGSECNAGYVAAKRTHLSIDIQTRMKLER